MTAKASPGSQLVCQYDAYIKTSLRNESRNYYREQGRRRKKEISFNELSDSDVERLGLIYNDEYSVFVAQVNQFHVAGYDMSVDDDALAHAIALLPQKQQQVVLLYYLLEFNDREIARILGMAQSTVQYNRQAALDKLKCSLEG